MNVTKDTLFNRELICFQNEKGYRFSIDSVLLAHFVRPKPGDKVLDLGTGCGVICLILNYRHQNVLQEVSGVEIQESLYKLANKNYKVNKIEIPSKVHLFDVKEVKNHILPESFDVITCNPPFYKSGSGRISQNEEAKIARHQHNGLLDSFLFCTSFVLKNGGRAYYIYPSNMVTEFMTAASKYNLTVKQLRFIYSYPESTASSLTLIECKKNGKTGVEVKCPLYIYSSKNGSYFSEVSEYYEVS